MGELGLGLVDEGLTEAPEVELVELSVRGVAVEGGGERVVGRQEVGLRGVLVPKAVSAVSASGECGWHVFCQRRKGATS